MRVELEGAAKDSQHTDVRKLEAHVEGSCTGRQTALIRLRRGTPEEIDVAARVHLREIVALDVFRGGFELVPHARFDGAAAVAEFEAKIRAALARVAQFFFVHVEKTSDVLFGEQIRDVRRLHWPEGWPEADFFPNKRYFLWPFLDLLASVVALTSWISELPPPAISW